VKVCCVLTDAAPALKSERSAGESALEAWARALDAERLPLETLRTSPGGAARFDVVLIEADAAGLSSIHAVREWLGPISSCLLVAHVSRSLPANPTDLRPFHEALAKVSLVISPQASVSADLRGKLGMAAFTLIRPQRLANEVAEPCAGPRIRGRKELCVLGRAGYSRLAFLREVGALAYVWAELRFRLRFLPADAPILERADHLRQSHIVYLACSLEDGGELAAFCARAGAILLAPLAYDPARVTFPYTTLPHPGAPSGKRRRSLLLLWLYTSADFVAFFRDTARKRLALLRDENCRVQFFRRIAQLAPQHEYYPQPGAAPSLWQQIRHRSGPRVPERDADSCVVVCLVRNGREHLPSFLRHYRALGVRELVFIDNGSNDGTLELLEQDPTITVYETSLSHKDYETQIRRLVIEQHCRKRWCLNVDIDELFDYPRSGELPLCGLLAYLSQRGATAMVGHMLDMYDEQQRNFGAQELDLRAAYPNYDVSHLERADYHAEEQLAFCDRNVLKAPIQCFSGGIRQSVFGSKAGARYLLIKHPLIFFDGELEPVTHPHYSNHATIADVTSVLYHYKFTPSFKAKALESQTSERYVKFAQQQYDQYLKKLGGGQLAIASSGTRRLRNVDELTELGFLRVSSEYREFVARYESPLRVANTGAFDARIDAGLHRPTSTRDTATPRAG